MYFWVFFLFKFFFLSKLSISGLSCFKNIYIYTCKKTCIKSLCPLIAWGVCLSGRVRYKNAILFYVIPTGKHIFFYFFNGRTTKVFPGAYGSVVHACTLPPYTLSGPTTKKKHFFMRVIPNELIVINM